jgi:hypothetical protein
MRFVAAILTMIRSAVQAALSVTWQWCAKTGKWVGKATQVAASLPGLLIGSLFGSAPLPPAPEPSSESADAVKNALDTLTERRRKIDMQDQMARRSDPVGETIHAYAAASEDERLHMDLDALPKHVRVWLLTRKEADLKRLAAAGPVKCGLIAAGKRSGVVGIEPPDSDQPMSPESVVRRLDADELFDRIARAKGVHGRVPMH